jgi:hypothetical protein
MVEEFEAHWQKKFPGNALSEQEKTIARQFLGADPPASQPSVIIYPRRGGRKEAFLDMLTRIKRQQDAVLEATLFKK